MIDVPKLVSPEQAEAIVPGFFKGRGSNAHQLTVGCVTYSPDLPIDWRVLSPFGGVEAAVVIDPKTGQPSFDRPVVWEAPNVNIVVWGRRKEDGMPMIGVIHQPRPHADDPRDPASQETVVFGQTPMGFLEKLLGEKPEDAARREAGEEAGAGSAIIRAYQPSCPWHNPNPTFVRSWSDLYFVEVDLEQIEALKEDHSEPIYKLEYIPLPELLRRLREGEYEGALYRGCTSNSVWLIWLVCHIDIVHPYFLYIP